MHKIWVVMRREFIERVRNKWFIVSTILGPLLMGGMIVIPLLLADRGGRQRTIVVVDVTTSDFGRRVTDRLNGRAPVEARRLAVTLDRLEAVGDSLVPVVGEKAIDGFLILTDATVEDGKAEYRGANVSSLTDMSVLERTVREIVLVERLNRVGVDPELVARATIPVSLTTVSIRGGKVTEDSGEARFFLAYLLWFILYIAILLYGVQVLGSVVEEKTSRIVEVLVSSLRPFELLAGKVVGVGSVGLFQFLIWGVSAKIMIDQREAIAGMVGVDLAGSGGGFSMPEVPVSTIVIFLVYFVLGYFLYASMFAAVAAMSNTEAEARQAQTPVVMLLVIPTMLMLSILQQPDGGIAIALSLIPFCSPIAMPVRWAAAEVPLDQVAMSIGFLVLGLLLITWLAARIYRVGILMHGKRPNIRELVRWVRTR
ncbi:MAG TPA: ABC transporter permease [Gemmatimonadales bacterium]|jgi:ABC-2 type transport system permease protein